MGAGSLYVVSSTIIQMVTRGFASREFAGRSSFGIKFANSSDAMPAWSVHRLFSLQGFPTFVGHISPYRCARNFDIVKLKFSFYLAVLLNYYAYTYSFFDNIFHTVCKKKPGHLLLGLSCKVLTLDHLFSHRSDFFNNLTNSLTKWLEYRKNRCLSSSKNSVRLHCRERVEKTKENAKKNENRKPTKWARKIWREKIRVRAHLGKNLKNIIISSNFSLKWLWTVI